MGWSLNGSGHKTVDTIHNISLTQYGEDGGWHSEHQLCSTLLAQIKGHIQLSHQKTNSEEIVPEILEQPL